MTRAELLARFPLPWRQDRQIPAIILDARGRVILKIPRFGPAEESALGALIVDAVNAAKE